MVLITIELEEKLDIEVAIFKAKTRCASKAEAIVKMIEERVANNE